MNKTNATSENLRRTQKEEQQQPYENRKQKMPTTVKPHWLEHRWLVYHG